MNVRELIALTCIAFLVGCGGVKSTEEDFVSENIRFAHAQIGNEIKTIEVMRTGEVVSFPDQYGIYMS